MSMDMLERYIMLVVGWMAFRLAMHCISSLVILPLAVVGELFSLVTHCMITHHLESYFHED